MKKQVKLLIADDHQILANGLADSIKTVENFNVIGWAKSGREAIEAADKHCPDIVIMDVSMPDMNGMEATLQICKMKKDISVLALSMHTEHVYISGMLKAGASGYVLKSCSFNELISAIKTILDGEQYICEEALSTLKGYQVKNASSHDMILLLSKREREILRFISEGFKTKDIAKKLNISNRTVDIHRSNLKNKLNIQSVAELTKFAITCGVTSPTL